MSTPTITTIDEAEAAFVHAFTARTVEPMRLLLHPDFTAVHGPLGQIHNAEQFIADSSARPKPGHIQIVQSTVRDFGDMATVSCIQQFDVPFAPDVPPFALQAAATRVWVLREGGWLLAHLQMARRLPPG
jgi:uncharacterized protein DUF4440